MTEYQPPWYEAVRSSIRRAASIRLSYGTSGLARSTSARWAAVRLAHRGGGADQEVAEAGACCHAGVAMVRRVAVREMGRVLPLAGEKDPLPGDEDAVEDENTCRLAVLVREQRRLLAGPSRR